MSPKDIDKLEDMAALKAMLKQLLEMVESLQKTIEKKDDELAELRRRVFGQKSERMPSVQAELVRRASLEPVRKLWTSTSSSATPPESAEAPSTEAAAVDAGEQADAEAAVAIEVDDAGVASDDAIDAGDVAEEAPHDASAPRPIARPRPLVKAPVKKASPPAPWTWKKQTPHPPPKHR